MKKLNYQTLKESGYDGYILENAPERILQFGEGNFLRAFVDYFIDNMNEKADFNSKVVLVQPIPSSGGFDLKMSSMSRKAFTPYICAASKTVRK